MHSRYAAVFDIENLELNTHFRPVNTEPLRNNVEKELTPASFESLELSSQLLADINRAAVPVAINSVVKSKHMQLTGDQLELPSPQLNATDKRALWALISEHLDKL
ncbi:MULTISPECIES: hypothetical protein [Pseudoalteromonas]|jgi:hypothetical protein|uniref:hypothetical protein n=1 Tax=Pseudoalteromonas TaxID=53246 RepID=UPI00194EE097|nr:MULTISPECIES: hypothetical protein [Pseudoalteromonas]MDP2484247.1 hypothetical protein [Pseudoalteromonas marina]UOB74244.1 hypothetical protein MTP24_03660 [Pseudoalteromonas sp. APM04]BBW92360.1 hypothetical protein PS1M3_24470 [Pseudoalteromonas sp. PS1M3]|tara:strand:- start:4213 stop:4530 length:318 start_codon:yes stop_codon:yes gene_type:complete